MKKLQPLLSSAMGPTVVEYLQKTCSQKLPRKGFLAGQAVDSALTDLFAGGGGVFNDFDIFRMVPRERGPLHDTVTSLTTRGGASLDVHAAYGGLSAWIELVATYSIKSVSREGDLNYVNCCAPLNTLVRGFKGTSLDFNPLLYLKSFDINCTQVGVDLKTKQLLWTPAYEEFYRTRQLKISAVHTPNHTFLRLIKKYKELPGVFVNLEQEAAVCMSMEKNPALFQLKQQKCIELLYGQKMRDLADAHSSELSPYFEQVEKTFTKGPSSKKIKHSEWTEVDPSSMVSLWTLNTRGALDPAIQRASNSLGAAAVYLGPARVRDTFVPSTSKAFMKWHNTVNLTAIKEASLQATAENHLHNDPEVCSLVVDSKIRSFVQLNAMAFGLSYTKGQAIPAVESIVNQWCTDHPTLAPSLGGLCLQDQHRAIHAVQDLARNIAKDHCKGDTLKVLGMIESRMTPDSLRDLPSLEQQVVASLKQEMEPFKVTPLVLPENVLGFNVEEILTPLELTHEGRIQHHCVAGYGHRIRSNACRILRVTPSRPPAGNTGIDLDRSTVELIPVFRKGQISEFKIGQNRSFSNREPSLANQQAVADLLTKLNNSLASDFKFR